MRDTRQDGEVSTLGAALAIWALMICGVLCLLGLLPVARFVLGISENKSIVHFVIGIPALAVLALLFLTLLKGAVDGASADGSERAEQGWYHVVQRPEAFFYAAVLWSSYTVLLTGGILGSPIASLLAVVPLLSSPFVGAQRRGSLLLLAAVCAIAVGILSQTSPFTPPESYPNTDSWVWTGRGNHLIAMFVIVAAMIYERYILRSVKLNILEEPAI